ncbi:maker704 [Drosophila busckii]|uniref:CG4169 n=1 Tax=Drosophila busckii TaxID=30019 RepID=A0A0M4ENL9_DROBS|nr:LOW QUALITY PROTEIN: cytochrome b-c1 complex subunit 2, mitochondrial [Drosophila busckii]ALC43567.1 CG4169 [Drosophila busckii]ALC43582.1 CG4169 [Drosophila busckii]ALC43995.1 maker704 [Drosophila busckii]
MACNASKTNLLRAIAKRGYATCPRPVGDTAAINVNVLDNKLVVATADASVPVTRVSIVLRAGARHEAYDTLGASHMLRLAGSMSTQNSTAFAIARHIQQVGGTLISWGDRELVGYTVETTSDNVETGLCYLQDLVQPAFKPWELKDNTKTLLNQLDAVSTKERAIELVHKAAFRRGLGNSIYIPRFQLGKLSNESLLHYVASNYSPSSAAVVGVGIDNNTLSGFAQTLNFPSGGGSAGKSEASYFGGDARKDTAGHRAVVAVAGEGGAASNHKEALAFAILEQAVGAGAATKRGNSAGLFGEAVSCAGDAPVQFRALNASYSDSGLFGFVVAADGKEIGKAVDFLARALKSGAVSDKDVARGKALLKARVMGKHSSDGGLIKQMGRQAALTRTVLDANTLIGAIDGISLQQVQAAAKKVAGSKLSVGAIGHLANVPYASDLA